MNYQQPAWITDFKKRKLKLALLTDVQLNGFWADTLKCYANNLTTYNLAVTLYDRLLKDAAALYGDQHAITRAIRKQKPEKPSILPSRKAYDRLVKAVALAKKEAARREKARAANRAYYHRKKQFQVDLDDAACLEGATWGDLYALEPTEVLP